MANVVALIAGNGLAIDLAREYGLWDPSEPLRFDFLMPGDLPWQLALPEMASHTPQLLGTSFEALQRLPVRQSSRLDAEVRHFLALAYSHFDQKATLSMLLRWRWRKWLRQHQGNLHSVVSFNYETFVERALESVIGRPIQNIGAWHQHRHQGPLLFKPHGSIDLVMAPGCIEGQEPEHPLNIVCSLNNTPVVQCSRAELFRARREAFTVLPGEASPYRNFQWVAPVYQHWNQLASKLTHCVVAGISYWECDQPELDFLLSGLPKRTEVIIANPAPSPSLIQYLESNGRRYRVWQSGPQGIGA
jgi:hypothetical protein